MRTMSLYCNSVLVLAVIIFVLIPSRASTQEVGLVAPNAKEVAKGYRASALELKSVVNDKGGIIGQIDDFIFGRDNGPVFAVLAVGAFVGLDGELVAVPFRSLKLDDPSGNIVLPGASLRGSAEAAGVPLQSLNQELLHRRDVGLGTTDSQFGILLFQDIATIPLLVAVDRPEINNSISRIAERARSPNIEKS